MTVLTWQQRQECFGRLMSLRPSGLTKDALRAAVDAADDWVDANAAAFSAALPQPARGVLTASEKAALLMFVVQKRYG